MNENIYLNKKKIKKKKNQLSMRASSNVSRVYKY